VRRRTVHAVVVSFVALGCATRLPPAELSDLRALASGGSLEAQLELGNRYRDGTGVPRDVPEAIDWYVQATQTDPIATMTSLLCSPVLEARQLDAVLTALDRAAFPAGSADAAPIPVLDSPGTIPGIRNPTLLREVKPNYTQAAMADKIQGTVFMDAVLSRTGSVNGLRVVRSLDREKGLDQSALCAASQWQFAPAMTNEGAPTAIIIRIEMEFALH